jgi:hypothetical protein
MSDAESPPSISPHRDDVLPDTYGIYVTDQHIHVWQFRVTLSDPDGEWYFVETLNRDSDPRLSLDQATPMAPGADGYWMYSRSYDCTLDCE